MKKIYEEPKIEIIGFDCTDIITFSGGKPFDESSSENIGEWDLD